MGSSGGTALGPAGEQPTPVSSAPGQAATGPASFLQQPPRLLFITLNEGALRVEEARLRSALEAGFASACRAAGVATDAVGWVVLARQECCRDNAAAWDAALSSLGFPHQVLRTPAEGVSAGLVVHARCAGICEVAAEPLHAKPAQGHDSPDKTKGVVAAAVRLPGQCNLCLGSVHLDGKVADGRERVAQLPAAVLRMSQRAGPLDVVLLAGDVNCTIVPEAALGANGEGGQWELQQRLVEDLARAAALPKHDAVVRLDPETRAALQAELASPAGRARLQRLDSCPEVIPVDADMLRYDANAEPPVLSGEVVKVASISNLQLAPMPPGSFLTYRVCNANGAASAEPVGCMEKVADGVYRMSPSQEVTSGLIDGLYFSSKDGKAGAIKKRGDMTRLQLGWLDRLYSGASSSGWRPSVFQGDPLMLEAVDGTGVLDHLLVPWLVTLPGCRTGGRVSRAPRLKQCFSACLPDCSPRA